MLQATKRRIDGFLLVMRRRSLPGLADNDRTQASLRAGELSLACRFMSETGEGVLKVIGY
jgi:hypothetical protein